MNDIIFAIDPGSIRTGWALMRPPEQLIKAGLLLPEKQKASSEVRIAGMCHSLWSLLNYWQPGTILIEWTSGKIGKRHGARGQGLGVHGASTGAIWRECVAWHRWQPARNQLEIEIVLVNENRWTRGVPKKERATAIAAMFPEYKVEKDPGLDLADALGLGLWYLRERKVRLVERLK